MNGRIWKCFSTGHLLSLVFSGLILGLADDGVRAEDAGTLERLVRPTVGDAAPPAPPPTPQIHVDTVNVTGNTRIGSDEIHAVIDPLIPQAGEEATLVQLQKIADTITDLYHAQGYALAKAYLPEQEIQGGVLQIAVREGTIGSVTIEGNQFYSSQFIQKHLSRFQDKKAVHDKSLERSMLILNEYSDLKAKGVLRAGSVPETTDMVVQVQDTRPLHVKLDYNNSGSKVVGKHRYGLELYGGNLLGDGSTFSLRSVLGSESPRKPYWSGSLGIPVGAHGTRVNLVYSRGNFDIGGALAVLDITAKTTAWGVAVTHPFIKGRRASLTGEIGIAGEESRQLLFGSIPFSEDRTSVIHVGLHHDSMDTTGRNLAAVSFYRGLGDALGGMERDAPRPSRFGANNSFEKGTLEVMRLQRVTDSLSLTMRGVGQLSSDTLVVGEQFSLGGPNSVRGYRNGEFLSDNGYSLHAEAQIAPFNDKGFFQAAIFVDQGEGYSKRVPIGEVQRVSLSGVGFGIRLNLPYAAPTEDRQKHFSLRADVGYPLEDGLLTQEGGSTYYVSLAGWF